PPYVLARVNDKPPGLTAEEPAPFADTLVAHLDLREHHLGALIGPNRDRAAADLDLPSQAMAPANPKPHVAPGHRCAVGARPDQRQRAGELEYLDRVRERAPG